MSVLAVQAVPNVPDSLLLIDSTAADISGTGEEAAGAGGLFLNIGASANQPSCCSHRSQENVYISGMHLRTCCHEPLDMTFLSSHIQYPVGLAEKV